MKKLHLIYLIIAIGFLGCYKPSNSKIKFIPKSLIEQIRTCNGNDSLINVINREIFRLVKDSIVEEDQYFGVMNPMFIDLDTDQKLELIGLFGTRPEFAHLAVFNLKKGYWECIFFEEFGHYYDGVNFSVMNNAGKEKVIVIKNLEARGSGIYKEANHFFKLINGEFKHCLRLVSDSRILGWGLYMNQTTESEFHFSSDNYRDRLWVVHQYAYFPGAIYENDAPWRGHPEITLIQETEGMYYNWNSEKHIYEPEYKDENTRFGMTKLQLQAIDEFGNDSLIVKAFQEQFEKILQGEDEEKKKIVSKYLKIVEKEQKAHLPSGEVEKIGETESGLEYYGVKK